MYDIIIKSRNIYSPDGSGCRAGMIFIKDGKIAKLAFGDGGALPAEDAGRIVDCGDGTVLPGFCDSHIHGFLGSLQQSSVDLSESRSAEEAAEMTQSFYRTSESSRLIGFGWNHYNWKDGKIPDRHSLDPLFRDRPVYLFNEELHSLWLNTAALEEAGIDENSKQPSGGEIVKDAYGRPTGYLLEPAAVNLAAPLIFGMSRREKTEIYENLIGRAAGCGITALGDIQIYDTLDCGIYSRLEEEGRLNCRIFPVFPMAADIDELCRLREVYDSRFIRFSGVKEFLDGTAAMHTGMLVDGYEDRPGYNAPPLVDVDATVKKAVALDAEGFRIRFHACGAGAVRLALDIFEEVRKKNGAGGRHCVEHIENISPQDIPRFRELGVIASVQPDHLVADRFEDHPFHKILGPKRCRWTWPFKSLAASGADMAFGTDYPVSPLNPMQSIYRAVSRLHEDGKPDGGWNPEQKLSVSEAVDFYTSGSARLMYAEDRFGVIAEGMDADLCIVGGRLLDMSPDEIRSAQTVMTICAGRITHSAF